MAVMSSVRSSFSSQSLKEVATSSRAAACGSPLCFNATSITSWFSRNSKTPSEQMTRHLSSGWSARESTSGSGETPIFLPMASPMERVKAHPGKSCPLTHARGGSPALSIVSSPKSSLIGTSPSFIEQVANSTKCEAFFMRSRSSPRKHVWSFDTSTALQPFPPLAVPMMARESPTFATCSICPHMNAVTAVVPLKLQSCRIVATIFLFACTKDASYADVPGAGMASFEGPYVSYLPDCRISYKYFGISSFAWYETCSPIGPCPSKTPKRI
mmetsp:Transcript_23779/g.77313  ORF Transcript_23779/g.77313 Transcript_23779/m.77313 type:complete len:271 (+) Transcript_23779:490-1302(+)